MTDLCDKDFTKQKRIIALITAIVMAMAMSFCVYFVAKNSQHDCTSQNCQICQHINNSLKLLNNLTPDPQNCVSPVKLLFTAASIIAIAKALNCFFTLVDLKVKLSY
ncbi:MAG: hypothetical protein ACI4RR_08470 [Eubacterium sp.]